MKKIIAKIWNGDLDPVQHLGEGNHKMSHLEYLIYQNHEIIEKGIDEDTKKDFKKYNNCMSEYVSVVMEQAFCDGFCLGAKITAEALTGADKMT